MLIPGDCHSVSTEPSTHVALTIRSEPLLIEDIGNSLNMSLDLEGTGPGLTEGTVAAMGIIRTENPLMKYNTIRRNRVT